VTDRMILQQPSPAVVEKEEKTVVKPRVKDETVIKKAPVRKPKVVEETTVTTTTTTEKH
ncbi:MAG: hypothetical protein QOD99_357, partial [Chthoniobacter sp.]|nr:hypothetical protein [Chthoniobacter sp.]